MYTFYIIALIPAIIGCILFIFNRNIHWQEWICGTICAFLVSGLIHIVAFHGITADLETWSGSITKIAHFPKWTEEYRKRHTETYYTGSGKNRQAHTRTWYTTEHQTHPEHWVAYANYGEYSEDKNISVSIFNDIKKNFGGNVINGGKQSPSHGGKFDGGDNNIYVTQNSNGYIVPVTTTRHFTNKIKATPSVFSFAKVPAGIPVYPWPNNPDWMRSGRLMGVKDIGLREFDLMNTYLGPKKKVNVIIAGFKSADSTLGQWQEAAWTGGKKNDLVLTYGYEGTNVLWAKVFGWTDKTICKANLETILTSHPINNDILPLIQKEILVNYTKKNWHDFDYLTVDPPPWAYTTLIIIMVISQGAFWIWSHYNEFHKMDG